MNKEELLFSKFTGKYLKFENEYFVQADYAITFIDLIVKNNIKILGIDGFNIYKNDIKPNIEVISDWSGESLIQSIEKSKIFISTNNNLVSHFNFVLDIELNITKK